MAYKSTSKLCTECGETRMIEINRSICAGCRDMIGKAKRHDGVLPPEYEDITIEKYKEPMERVVGGHGYFGAITESKDGKYIQCHICGYFFPNLASHIRKHGVDHKEYKIHFGLRIKDGLVSKTERHRLQDSFNALVRATGLTPDEYARKAGKAGEAGRVKAAKEGRLGGNQWKDITRNERGNCKAQTIVKIQTLASQNEGYISEKMFLEAYGKGQQSVIKTHFGNFDEGLRQAKLATRGEQAFSRREQREDVMIKKLKKYYEVHGRSPQWADIMNSHNRAELPSQRFIHTHWRTLNNARFLAGIPMIIQNGKDWHEVKVGDVEYDNYELKI